MGLKVKGSELVTALQDYINDKLGAYKVRLYVNNYTPDETSTNGSFTEATFTGYAVSTGNAMGAAALVGTTATATGPQVTFTATAGGSGDTVYGYYVQDSAGNYLFAEKAIPAGFAMGTNGLQIAVTPKVTAVNQ